MKLLMNKGQPLTNQLAWEPRIAYYLDSWITCQQLGCLPAAGGLDDQEAAWVAYAKQFAQAQAKHQKAQVAYQKHKQSKGATRANRR